MGLGRFLRGGRDTQALFVGAVFVAAAYNAWQYRVNSAPVQEIPLSAVNVTDLNPVEAGYYWMLTNYTESQICTWFTFIYHEALYFGWYVPWLIIDSIPAFRQYKIQPKVQNDTSAHWKCLKILAMNHILFQLPMMMLFHMVVKQLGMRFTFPLPEVTTLMWQIPMFFIIEDFYFYWIHRLLHYGPFYTHIHKMHHDHKAPFGIAAEYAHPVETVFLGVGTMLGPVLFAEHIVTVWVWLFFRLAETIEDHSGYTLPWYLNPTGLIPFWGGADHHDIHHELFKVNYASVFSVWDTIFGTDTWWRQRRESKARGGKTAKPEPPVTTTNSSAASASTSATAAAGAASVTQRRAKPTVAAQ